MLSVIISLSLLTIIIIGIGIFVGAFILHKTLFLLAVEHTTYKKALKIQVAICLMGRTIWLMMGHGFSQGMPEYLGLTAMTIALGFLFFGLLLRRFFRLDLGSSLIIYIIYSFLYIAINLLVRIPYTKFIGYFDTMIADSMTPTITSRNIFFVDLLAYKIGEPQRGDIVQVYNEGYENLFIRRIIGLPQENIVIRNGKIFVCEANKNKLTGCEELDEPYFKESQSTSDQCEGKKTDEYTLSNGYFVMNDKRDSLIDSRCCFKQGCENRDEYEIARENIKAKVSYSIFPTLTLH